MLVLETWTNKCSSQHVAVAAVQENSNGCKLLGKVLATDSLQASSICLNWSMLGSKRRPGKYKEEDKRLIQFLHKKVDHQQNIYMYYTSYTVSLMIIKTHTNRWIGPPRAHHGRFDPSGVQWNRGQGGSWIGPFVTGWSQPNPVRRNCSLHFLEICCGKSLWVVWTCCFWQYQLLALESKDAVVA